jgi:hypothetical protein
MTFSVQATVLLGALLMLGVCVSSARAAEPPGTRWNLDEVRPGTLPGWLNTPVGKWEVREAADSPAGKRALFQAAKNSGSTFNIAVDTAAQLQNLELTTRMKAVAGEEDQGGGLVWRYRDARNYYIARYNPLEDNYRLYKVVNGSRRELASANVKAAPGWHQLTIRMSGKHITCDLDGKTYLTVDDGTFPDAGTVGLWSKADAQTLFAGLEAHALP